MMDLQTYVIWKYKTGENLCPKEIKEKLRESKNINDFLTKIKNIHNNINK